MTSGQLHLVSKFYPKIEVYWQFILDVAFKGSVPDQAKDDAEDPESANGKGLCSVRECT